MDEFISKINVNNKDYELQDIEARQQATNFATQDQIDALYENDNKEFIVLTNLRKFARKLSDFAEATVQDFKDLFNSHISDTNNPHQVTKVQVGLGNVDNVKQIPDASLGVAGGVATLDSNVKVPFAQMPVGTSAASVGRGDYAYAGYDHSLVTSGNPHNVTQSDVGLGNVDNTSDLNKPISTAVAAALSDKIDSSMKGVANGVATLDNEGHVPSSQLPSYVDEIIECDTYDDFPRPGESGKIYIAKDTNKTYRWGGTDYVEISASLALGTGHGMAYYGDQGEIAYQHTFVTVGNPHNVTKSQIGLGNVLNVKQIPDASFGVANGVARLDENKKHVVSEIPFGDTSVNVFRGDYGKVAYEHTFVTAGNPHNVTRADLNLDLIDTSLNAKVDKETGKSLVPDVSVTAYDAHIKDTTSNPHNITRTTLNLQNIDSSLNTKVDKVVGKSLVSDTSVAAYDAHIKDTSTNPHNVTAAQVGLGNVNNTSDANKPISTAAQAKFDQVDASLNEKVDKVAGKGLSTNDFTNAYKTKLENIEAGAQVNTITGVKGDAEGDYRTGNVNITKVNIGLGSVDNVKQIPDASRGVAGGVATLGSDGKVPSAQLPEVVNEIVEAASKSAFPTTGDAGKIYVAKDTNKIYRWNGTAYSELSPNDVTGVKGSNESTYRTGNVNITKANIGLGSVDNVKQIPDASYGVPNGVATLDATGKHTVSEIPFGDTSNKVFRGDYGKTAYDHATTADTNPHGTTKSDVSLGNVDNTSDMDKPISTAAQAKFDQVDASLNEKVDKVAGKGLSTNDFTTGYKNKLDNLDASLNTKVDKVTGKSLVADTSVAAYDAHIKDTSTNPHNITRATLNLQNIDSSLNAKVDKVTGKSLVSDSSVSAYDSHLSNKNNPHNVTAAQLNLEKVDNTHDIDKPISNATQAALDDKVDKVVGKGLSTNDYTTEEKNKLAGIEAGAQVNTVTGVKGNAETTYRIGNINITQANIGLDKVDNTHDLDKPISTATQDALDEKVDKETGKSLVADVSVGLYDSHIVNTSNPHNVTKTQVGLGNVLNTKQIPDASFGAANGVATLDSDGKHTVSQIRFGDSSTSVFRGDYGKTAYDHAITTDTNPHGTTKADVDLGNVLNVKQIPDASFGVANGVATLGSDGKVPSSQLPSYVDDVIECDTFDDFPATGEAGKIYIAKDTNKTYRWSGTQYVEISASLALGTTHQTAYYGDLGQAAYDHSQLTSGNPHNVTKDDVSLGNVDNVKQIPDASRGVANGVATLNANTKIPVEQIPVGDTSTTVYRGDLGKTAYDHSQLTTGNPHNVTKTDLSLENVTNDAQVKRTEMGAANGVAMLDASTMVPASELHIATQAQVDGLYSDADKKFVIIENIRKLFGYLVDYVETFAGDVKNILLGHISNMNNPHNITKTQLGLNNVTNDAQVKRTELGAANGVATLDSNKKIAATHMSYATDANIDTLYSGDNKKFVILSNLPILISGLISHVNSWGEELSLLLNAKVDKVIGKSLSTNDFDNTYKGQLDNLDSVLASKIDSSLMGVANGVATLDTTGKVPAAQLPAFVDVIVEYDTRDDFPATGESGKIYVAKDTNKTYRWSGSQYVEISSSLALGETSSSAYRGDRGKIAYDHATSTETNPHGTTRADLNLENIDTSLAAKLDVSLLNEPNGIATLNSLGKILSAQLPSLLQLGTTHQTAYYGDLGQTAYSHSQLTSGNPHHVTKAEIGLGNVLNYKQIPESAIGIAGGVAPLDASTKVSLAYLPELTRFSHVGLLGSFSLNNDHGYTMYFDIADGYIESRRCLYRPSLGDYLWDVHFMLFSNTKVPLSVSTGSSVSYRDLFHYSNFPMEYSGNYVCDCVSDGTNISSVDFKDIMQTGSIELRSAFMKLSYKCDNTNDIAGPTILDLYCKFALSEKILEIPCDERVIINLFLQSDTVISNLDK